MNDRMKSKGSLSVEPGISQPPSVNPNLNRNPSTKQQQPNASRIVEGILSGDTCMLSQAITIVESSLPVHQELGQRIVEQCLPYASNSMRIGITGSPGVGKSTFIEAFGHKVVSDGHKLAVLAIDPSSELSKGSILGDKTRMTSLSNSPNVFIRPSPSSGNLGGIGRKTREAILLCEAAGFDTIIVETVGVGQSETTVHSMVDFFLLLMLAGSGDELQGIKRGIMEMADLIAITKADGNNESNANLARAQFMNALNLFPPTPSGWKPLVRTCSSVSKQGIDTIWNDIQEFGDKTRNNGFFDRKRLTQAKSWMHQNINEALMDDFYSCKTTSRALKECDRELLDGRTTSFAAAQKVLEVYFKERDSSSTKQNRT